MTRVPTLDLSRPTAHALAEIDAACRDHGFFLLTGHGLADLVERTWKQTERFFDAPECLRRSVLRSAENPLGYYDRELTKRRRDQKQVFDFMDPSGARGRARNRWPEGLPGFRETLTDFFSAMTELAARTLGVVHAALGLEGGAGTRLAGSAETSTVRLNCYPTGDPVAEAERAALPRLGELALHPHTDPGVLTLLLQDATGGLQTLSGEDGWIDVPPRPGGVVVNLGDVLQVWSNDRYRAAAHRVLPRARERRFSIPYFSNPAVRAVIQPDPALLAGPPRYRPFTWREFMQARVDDNYRDLGADDTQISDFRLGAD